MIAVQVRRVPGRSFWSANLCGVIDVEDCSGERFGRFLWHVAPDALERPVVIGARELGPVRRAMSGAAARRASTPS
ncbi:hypothetical protein ACWGKQ_24740 [Streptomyces sp. NPDC054770]